MLASAHSPISCPDSAPGFLSQAQGVGGPATAKAASLQPNPGARCNGIPIPALAEGSCLGKFLLLWGVAGVVCFPIICTYVGRRIHDLIRDFSSLLCEWSWQTATKRGQVQCSLTRRVLSTSPHGSRFTKSMPVSGVPVGGSRMETSIMRYSTFIGFIWKTDITEASLEGDGGRASHTGSSACEPGLRLKSLEAGRCVRWAFFGF